jgi:D-alanyl-D-alanine dipeptidase
LQWLRQEARPVLFQTKYICQLPEGFCYIKDYTPEVEYDIRFYGSDNIMGRQANEYYSPIGIASIEMARMLDKASLLLKEQGLTLLVYDSYRPQTTVNAIVDWLNDENDNAAKSKYYPYTEKSEMIDMFFEAKSPYPRGAAVDVSILDSEGKELDMGTLYQYIDETSSFSYTELTDKQYNNRELLRDVMIQAGLTPNDTFWWSFYIEDEPFPNEYFDFYIQ